MGSDLKEQEKPPFALRLAQAVEYAVKEKGLTQTRIAELAGMAPATLSEALKDGKRAGKFTNRIAEICGVSALWLSDGEGGMTQNVLATNVALGRVPLVSSVAAGMFAESIDLLPAGFAEEWVPCAVPVRAHTFALKVSGDSMEPRFHEGMILIVEPELEARPGHFVIAKNSDNEATFKQLVREGGVFYLKPLNQRYPLQPLGDGKIIGVVVQSFETLV